MVRAKLFAEELELVDFEDDAVEHIGQATSFSQSDREKMCGLNAVRLLNLDPEKFARAKFAGGAWD